VFEGGEAFKLLVRLRYRKHERVLQWKIDIYQLALAFRVALESECEGIETSVGLPLFFGSI
jgi:hypothetical protein